MCLGSGTPTPPSPHGNNVLPGTAFQPQIDSWQVFDPQTGAFTALALPAGTFYTTSDLASAVVVGNNLYLAASDPNGTDWIFSTS